MCPRYRTTILSVSLTLIVGLLGACDSTPAPVTQAGKISVERSPINVGEEVNLVIPATSGADLQFKWTATAGAFLSSATAPSVRYKAPDSPGSVVVTVEVIGKGGTVVQNITLQIVQPITDTPVPPITLTPTSTPTASLTPTPTVTPTSISSVTRTAWITHPLAGSQVAQFTTVTGEYSPDLTDDIWVFVQEQTGRYFPASMFIHQTTDDDCKIEGTIKRDGKWEMPVIIGGNSGSVGQSYNIILTVANPTVSQSISDMQRAFCLTRRFPGIPELPSGISITQRIRVIRGPEIGEAIPDVLDAQLPVVGEVSNVNITDQSEVTQTTWITGTQTGTTGSLWVLVYVYIGRWYPQSITPCIGENVRTENDKWWTNAGFGGPQDGGKPFDILVVQTDAEANQFFEKTQETGCKANYYQGLRTLQLPKGIAVMSHLRVYRQ